MPGGPTNLQSQDLKTVSIYPNPVEDYVWIENPENKELEFLLYDLYGQLILRKSNCTFIDMSNLSEGVYMLSIKEINSRNIETKKIIKMN
ncbi:T9SS type A sorting domain-containing protein [bacterium]|nr:T9SS type A sorting domain-containing protein [bacterium]